MSPTRTRPAPSDPAGPALVSLMRAAGALLRDLDQACQRHGITHDQYNVLRILRGVHPGGHPRGEISARLISRAPDVTRMLDRLVRRGLVSRGWDPANRRLSVATITRDGLALLRDCDHDVEREHSRHAHALSAEQLRTLARLCEELGP